MSEKTILFDTSKCTGCHACQVACKTWNGLPSPIEKNCHEFTGSLQSPLDLNGDTRLIMTYHEETGGEKGVNWAFGRRSCMHCENPACVTICPAGAVYVDEDTRLVTTDTARCIGCRYCSTACPFDVPHYHDGKLEKCTGCVDRIAQGRKPACVTTCVPGALDFGDRDDMVAKAEERLAVLKNRGYTEASIYGIDQLDGTHVIQVLKYPLSYYTLPADPQVNPLVGLTEVWRPLAGLAAGATVLGLGISFLLGIGYKRDTLHYDEKTGDTVDLDTDEVVAHKDLREGKGE
jgi:formate dehydrogenase beta subunit